jgi:hypothetical protein
MYLGRVENRLLVHFYHHLFSLLSVEQDCPRFCRGMLVADFSVWPNRRCGEERLPG